MKDVGSFGDIKNKEKSKILNIIRQSITGVK